MTSKEELLDIIDFIDFFYTDNLITTAERRKEKNKETQKQEKEALINKLNKLRDYVEKSSKDLEILEILKPKIKRDLSVEKIDLTDDRNKIYKGYLPKDYDKDYIYTWCYCYDTWDVFENEENAIKLEEWLGNDRT